MASNEQRDETGGSVIDDETLDRLMDRVDEQGLDLLGPGGVLTELTSRIMTGRWMPS